MGILHLVLQDTCCSCLILFIFLLGDEYRCQSSNPLEWVQLGKKNMFLDFPVHSTWAING